MPTYATTDSTGHYTATLTIPQVSGYYVARVRIIGADGTFSPSAPVSFQVDCSGAQVLGATYDRTANAWVAHPSVGSPNPQYTTAGASAASAQSGVPQTVSGQIKLLEDSLGCALFREEPTFDRLTNIGTHFVHCLAL